MLDGLIRASVRYRSMVIALTGFLLGAGAYVAANLPIDVFPDLTAPTVTVLVEGHGMAPEEMETLVTFPVEATLNGAAHVRRIRSATAVGITVVWVEFEWGTDVFKARQTVTERLATLAGRLPDQVEAPVLGPISSIMGEIMFVGVRSDEHDARELRTVADLDVRRRLLAVEGVSQVVPIGGEVARFEVLLDPERLVAFELSPQDVVDALSRENENVSAGVMVDGPREAVITGRGRFEGLRDLRMVLVAKRGDRPITVGDLGEVTVGSRPRRGTAASGQRTEAGEPARPAASVVLSVQKQPGADTLRLTAQLDRVLDEIETGLPEGMWIERDLFRQSRFIETAVDNTLTALIEGALMVIVIVVLFLLSARASLITLLAIPVSLLATVLVLEAFGTSLNTMTLGGMAIAIGALVDDAIIDVENVARRLRENALLPPELQRPSNEVVVSASVEVRRSIVVATILVVLVFLPLFFLSGVEGRLLVPLGVAFVVALGVSLLVALTLTPALASLLLTKSTTLGREPRTVTWAKRVYQPLLELGWRHPFLVIVPTVLLFALATFGLTRFGRDFLPDFNEGALVISLATLPGSSLDTTDALVRRAELVLAQHPEVVGMARRTGRAEEDEHVQGVEASEIDVTLDMEAPGVIEKRSKAELLEALRAELDTVPGLSVSIGQPISHRIDHMISGTQAAVAIKVFGPDLLQLRAVAARIETAVRDIQGVTDLRIEAQRSVPLVTVRFDREALARHGLTMSEAATSLRAATTGAPAGEVLIYPKSYDLVVRVGQEDSGRPEELERARLKTPDGAWVPLSAVADVRRDLGPNFISRENVQRKIVVQFNIADRDLGGVVDDARRAIETDVMLPPGYHVQFGGQFESAERTARRLLLLGIGIILAMGLLLHFAFGSARDAIFVLANLPLALIGGVAGVAVSGGVLSVASIIGFITVFGVAARNGILLMSHVRHLQWQEGVQDLREAVLRAGSERLAPILMTALSAGLALVPLALRADAPGTEILAPMAVVILFGLLSSTFLNLLVVPALCRWAGPGVPMPEDRA